jgi:hypothetical protein
MIAEKESISLAQFRGSKSTLFTGRPQGEEARKKLKLDELDNYDVEVELLIPDDTTSFNPSFYLGLLFNSIKKLGVENFSKKYHLIIESTDLDTITVLKANLDDGLRNATNTIEQKTGLAKFFKK